MDHHPTASDTPPYLDPELSWEQRADDLIARLTLEEKVSQMVHAAEGIERLGIPPYNWWNECLHGVGRAGIATVFPQAIGMAATWDVPLIAREAEAISDEARAKHHEALRQGIHDIYTGLTFWSPNINIFRDPRWGRGQETYGEDPYLTARLGVAFVQGLQGNHPRYLKLVATPKHYAVHSGPEAERHHFDARVSPRDLRATYLPAFEACVREGGAQSVMGAYNRTNGEPCCASPTLLQRILRAEWGFQGYVVSDCGAIRDIYAHHRVVSTAAEAAVLAVRHGCDLNCGSTYSALVEAVQQGLISEAQLNAALKRLFIARMRLGMFDPPENVPYAQIPYAVNDCPEHRALALQVARESLVLLKNDGILPLKGPASLAVIGPNAHDEEVLLGNYNGTPSRAVTPLEGLRTLAPEDCQVRHARGCTVTGEAMSGFKEALEAARASEVVIACMGLSQEVEGEEGASQSADREDLALPGAQEALLKALHGTGKPLIVVLLNGSALAVNWAAEHANATLEAWYPGEEGGTAIAEALLGRYNPGGRLPVTFYKGVEQLPPFTEYAMEAGFTYRYFRGEPLYPFGYGLSYTTFEYSDLRMPERVPAGKEIALRVTVRNTGQMAGDEVVQVYVRDEEASYPTPIRQLAAFARLHLAPGESRELSLTIAPRQLAVYDDEGRAWVEPGLFTITVGGGQPLGATPVLSAAVQVTGEAQML